MPTTQALWPTSETAGPSTALRSGRDDKWRAAATSAWVEGDGQIQGNSNQPVLRSLLNNPPQFGGNMLRRFLIIVAVIMAGWSSTSFAANADERLQPTPRARGSLAILVR